MVQLVRWDKHFCYETAWKMLQVNNIARCLQVPGEGVTGFDVKMLMMLKGRQVAAEYKIWWQRVAADLG